MTWLDNAAGEDYVIGRWRDDLDVEYVRVYTSSTELLIAALELRSDDACDRAIPAYEHWIRTYTGSALGGAPVLWGRPH